MNSPLLHIPISLLVSLQLPTHSLNCSLRNPPMTITTRLPLLPTLSLGVLYQGIIKPLSRKHVELIILYELTVAGPHGLIGLPRSIILRVPLPLH